MIMERRKSMNLIPAGPEGRQTSFKEISKEWRQWDEEEMINEVIRVLAQEEEDREPWLPKRR